MATGWWPRSSSRVRTTTRPLPFTYGRNGSRAKVSRRLRPDRIRFLVEAVLDASWNVAMSVATQRNHRLMA